MFPLLNLLLTFSTSFPDFSKPTVRLSYSDVLFTLEGRFGTGAAMHDPVPVSPSLGVCMEVGTGRLLLREGPGVNYKHSQAKSLLYLHRKPWRLRTTLASVAKTQVYEKWAILG